jgi:hypothetical protein
MAVSKRPAKATTQNERLLAVIEKQPGIMTSALRSRASKLGMTQLAVSQVMYLMERAGKIHYGEGTKQNREVHPGPAPSGKSSKTKKATAASVAPAPAAKTGRKTAKPTKKTRAAGTVPQVPASAAAMPQAPVSQPAASLPAVPSPSTALVLGSQADLVNLVSQPGGLETAITSFATQLASAFAQRIANEVRAQMEKQVVQQVSEVVTEQMNQLQQSISLPGMPNTSAAAIQPHHAQAGETQEKRGRKARTTTSARKENAVEVQSRPSRQKVVVLGLKPRFTEQVSQEFSDNVDLAFAGADEPADRLEKLVAEADKVVALTNTKGTRAAKLVKAHPHYSKVSGGLPKLKETLRSMH